MEQDPKALIEKPKPLANGIAEPSEETLRVNTVEPTQQVGSDRSPNEVNCKTCGGVMTPRNPDRWKLQCPACRAGNVPLPPGYENVHADHS